MFLVGFMFYARTPHAAAQGVLVTINADRQTASMPYTFRAGAFTFGLFLPSYVQQSFFDELKPGAIEIDLKEILQNSETPDDIASRIAWTDDLVKEIHKKGGKVVIAIAAMPLWLSSSNDLSPVPGDVAAKATYSPPKDYTAWAKLVERIVYHYNRELGIPAMYKIWWEPDGGYWQGTEEEYFKLYRYSVLGALRADSKAKIGGPGVSAFLNTKSPSGWPPLLQKFINYCAKEPLPELGLTRLPIDFIVWHQFTADPLYSWDAASYLARRWLSDAGYDPNTDLLIGEWSSWQSWPEVLSQERDTHLLAAYVVSTLLAMDRAGIKYHSFTSLIEQRQEEAPEFIGDFGLYTKSFIKKPAFHAFSILDQVGSKRLDVTSSEPLISVLGGADPGRVTAVLSSYIPTRSAILKGALAKAMTKGYTLPQLTSAFHDSKMFEQVILGQRSPHKLGLSSSMEQDFSEIGIQTKDLLQHAEEMSRQKTPVTVTFSSLPFKNNIQYSLYLIDSSHTNPVSVKSVIEPKVRDHRKTVKQKLRDEVFSAFKREGYDEQEISRFSKLLTEPDKRSFLSKISIAEQNRMLEMIRLTQDTEDDGVADIAREINSSPSVMLSKAATKTIPATQQWTVTIHMEPNSIAWLVLEEQK
ncbi:MAG: hypothetical protein OEY94_03510 [Alphaproteobacteria bacterium]|nr:hypothetical protein [Alphaproteobacteria bacterium]